MTLYRYMGTQEAAELLGYTRQHVRMLIRRDRLHADRVGKNWLIPDASIQAYLIQKNNYSLFGNTSRGRPSLGKLSLKKKSIK